MQLEARTVFSTFSASLLIAHAALYIRGSRDKLIKLLMRIEAAKSSSCEFMTQSLAHTLEVGITINVVDKAYHYSVCSWIAADLPFPLNLCEFVPKIAIWLI